MNLEQKEAIARDWITDETGVFARRTVPTRLDTQAKQDAEIRDIIRRIAVSTPDRLTEDEMRAALANLGDHLNATMKTAGWPSIHEVGTGYTPIVGRMTDLLPRQQPEGKSEAYWQQAARTAAIHIMQREPCCARALFGRRARFIIEQGLVPEPTLRRRRDTYRASLVSIYGEEVAARRVAELEVV